MVEVSKLMYIVVVDDEEKKGEKKVSFRYTRPVLQSTLQLMGCKARHAFKISKRVFELMKSERCGDGSLSTGEVISVSSGGVLPGPDASKGNPWNGNGRDTVCSSSEKPDGGGHLSSNLGGISDSKPYELYKRRTTVFVGRRTFLDVVSSVLAEYKYVGPNQRTDLVLACRLRERKESMTVLLCGTSGCGKSTLSALLASRLGITTVISTDSIRHMMRSFVDEKQNPLLWASTYHAGEYLDPVAVAEAKAKKKEKKLDGVSPRAKDNAVDGSFVTGKSQPVGAPNTVELISAKQMAVEGFKAQSEMVIDSLDRLITAWEERKESVVVEGVHLSLNFVMGLMKKHPSIIPFMIYITNEDKHMERFAVRAKYMTLDPDKNKYIKYIRNIRTIQEYLCKRADKHLVPKINNTNVDRSVAAIHATLFSCLRRRVNGEQLYDSTTNRVTVIDEEYRNQCTANSLSSKGMFQLIQRQGSSRHLMALLNNDGSVAKAWPVDSGPGHFLDNPLYGPLRIDKAEPVNLQFGHFGISAWPSDTGGTSHTSSVDESRGDGTDNGSRYYSSCCSSPKMSESAAKELMEEQSVHGSDEEDADDPPEVDSDEDLSDDGRREIHDEMEGSVDEESTKSDEEYDDLAMQDIQESGYLPDDDVSLHRDNQSVDNSNHEEKYRKNLDLFLRTKNDSSLQPQRSYSNERKEREKSEKKVSVRIRKRSQSIPSLPMGKDGSLLDYISFGQM